MRLEKYVAEEVKNDEKDSEEYIATGVATPLQQKHRAHVVGSEVFETL